MKPQFFAVAFLALLAGAHAATYASVTDAVKQLPELSMLSSNLEGTTLANQLSDAAFVGTVFVPTNTALKTLSDQIGVDFQSLMSQDPDQAAQVLSYSVVPGRALLTSALTDGTTLTTQSGDELAVTVKNGVVSINDKPITTGNIIAGKAIVHELDGILLPQELADMLALTTTDDAATAGDVAGVGSTPAAGPSTVVIAPATNPVPTTATDDATPAPSAVGAAGTAGGAVAASGTGRAAAIAASADARASAAAPARLGAFALAVPAILALLI
ncbi:hypothetical protein Rsub_08520 [Raphidocelis subcapitata]|uniref:FAS1 domain-containing protein n=1 Tax=Raphidocelis subcapitata TaxID=307507 RepID=A0A2V0P7K3_9CHLO|nr:hypothetical protein Rsub_08520 [Raphidocelis subcapitata]|eukprot:GBF95539.1 hypothetical protein Rsub_08520 [Raphidocelis subcapitata]